jgi:hypothetical protein
MSNWFFAEIFAYGIFAVMGATTIVWGIKKMFEMAVEINDLLRQIRKQEK